MEINNSKDKDRLKSLWRQKCELNRDIQHKTQQMKMLINQKNQVNDKLTTTMTDCNNLNNLIEFVEKGKWKKVFEKNIFVVLNSNQFNNKDENNYIPISLSNDENHFKSSIIINEDQINAIKNRIKELHLKTLAKNEGNKQTADAQNQWIEFKRKSDIYQDKFKEMMVLKLSTILPLNSINTLFEESNEQDISKLEREITNKEKEVTKELSYKIADIKTIKREKLEIMKANTLKLAEINEMKNRYQGLIDKIDKDKETSLN